MPRHTPWRPSPRTTAATVLAALALAACAPKPAFRGPVAPAPVGPIAGPHPATGPGPLTGFADSTWTPSEKTRRLEEVAADWIGTPYRRGGHDPRGIDCSGLTRCVLAEFGIALPRTTGAQRQVGRSVARVDLTPGDLLFFRLGSSRVNHVGIALDAERFLHASSTRGVVVERLENRYFSRRLAEIRRVWGG